MPKQRSFRYPKRGSLLLDKMVWIDFGCRYARIHYMSSSAFISIYVSIQRTVMKAIEPNHSLVKQTKTDTKKTFVFIMGTRQPLNDKFGKHAFTIYYEYNRLNWNAVDVNGNLLSLFHMLSLLCLKA